MGRRGFTAVLMLLRIGILVFPIYPITCVYAENAHNNSKPLLYEAIDAELPDLKRAAKEAFAGRYRIIEAKPDVAFAPGGKKGHGVSWLRFRDPRSMREYRIPGMIRWAFIVTPDGRVTEPRILHSTDERVSQYILNTIIYERYFPARFRGTPVHSLRAEQWKFGGDRAPDDRYFRDGTGINIRG